MTFRHHALYVLEADGFHPSILGGRDFRVLDLVHRVSGDLVSLHAVLEKLIERRVYAGLGLLRVVSVPTIELLTVIGRNVFELEIRAKTIGELV